ncbi:TetR/AcrR family transcriptional regulator [Natronobiforma cellulositropha]|uniref:TetR/AcrR family transcriptional regulator n=1 Tax=Natronobiforma cellulositropha TaxID=1679076 RepID=UPI0021D5D557|nr:TetR/AcrR family transcriptional regulator [Natronobiforma cellulositropha]
MGLTDAFDEPADTQEAVMAATYRALCRHGYAGLTIQRIADEFPKSKSLLYHHYESKDDLLLEFLAFMLEHFESTVPSREYDDAAAHLRGILGYVLPDTLDPERREFTRAMVELQAQAAHDEAYREHFTRSSRFFHDRIETVVECGIEEGVFREVDPDRIATLVVTAIDGARFRRSTAEVEETVPALRAELEATLESRLFADGTAGSSDASRDVEGVDGRPNGERGVDERPDASDDGGER